MIVDQFNTPDTSDVDLLSFTEGFEAGYNATSEHRAVLGAPAYRLGHAEGVQAAAARRQRATAPTSRTARLLRVVLISLMVSLPLGWGLVKSAKADTLANWNQLNEVCQGGTGVASDKACTARRGATAQLLREGWFQGAHSVWVSPKQIATFNSIVRHYDAIARENTGMLDKVMESMIPDLLRALPPEVIFAMWNGRSGQVLATTPYAASMLMYGLPYLERVLSGRNDPRFVMVLRP